MKLTPVVNFISVKRAHFSYEHCFSSYVLALSKILHEKFVRKTVMKLTPDVNFTNILRTAARTDIPKVQIIQSCHQSLFALLGSLLMLAEQKMSLIKIILLLISVQTSDT
jgi:hypothetical protein